MTVASTWSRHTGHCTQMDGDNEGFVGYLYLTCSRTYKMFLSITRTKVSLQKDECVQKTPHRLFWRLLSRSSLCQQRGMDGFKPLVVRGREGGESCLDSFLNS